MLNVTGKSEITPTESETTRTDANLSHGSRETPITSTSSTVVDWSENVRGHKQLEQLQRIDSDRLVLFQSR